MRKTKRYGKSTEVPQRTAHESSPTKPGGVRIRAEKVRWGEYPGGFESLGRVWIATVDRRESMVVLARDVIG